MTIKVSHKKNILTAGLLSVTLGFVGSVSAGEYRLISNEFSLDRVSSVCDVVCKSSLSEQAQTPRQWLKLGMKLVRQHNISAARFAFLEAIAVSEDRNELDSVPRALIELGSLAFSEKKFSEAQDFYENAVSVSEQGNSRSNGAVAYLNLGLVQRKMGEKSAARESFRNSLKLTRGSKFYAMRANAMFQYGRILKEQNNKVWARKALSTAKKISKKHGFSDLYRVSSRALSKITISRNVSTKARVKTALPVPRVTAQLKGTSKKQQKTVRVATSSSWSMKDQEMAKTYDRLGVSHIERRQYDMASEMFRKSIFLNKQMGSQFGQATGYHNLAKIYTKLGDHKNSCVNLWQARNLMTEANKVTQAESLTQKLQNQSCLMQQAALDMD